MYFYALLKEGRTANEGDVLRRTLCRVGAQQAGSTKQPGGDGCDG